MEERDSERERESSLPAWSVIVIPLLCYVGVRLLVVGAAAVRASVRGVAMEDAARAVVLDPLNLAAIQLVAFGAALFFGLALFTRGVRTRDALAITPVRPAIVVLAVIGGLALQFPLAEVGNLVQELVPVSVEEQILRQRMVTPGSLGSALAIVLAFVVVAPLSEEVVFRGFLLTGLAERYGGVFAIVATSLAFGAVHGDATAIVYASAAGLVLGTVARWTGSTLTSVAMHAAVNAVPVLLPERLVAIDGFNTVSDRVYHLPLPLLFGTTAVAAAALFVIHHLS
jgi:membrane protease YdiL (CAAX protease family)